MNPGGSAALIFNKYIYVIKIIIVFQPSPFSLPVSWSWAWRSWAWWACRSCSPCWPSRTPGRPGRIAGRSDSARPLTCGRPQSRWARSAPRPWKQIIFFVLFMSLKGKWLPNIVYSCLSMDHRTQFYFYLSQHWSVNTDSSIESWK